jgi:hypothetical protein
MSNPVVTQVTAWTKTYQDLADKALATAASNLAADIDSPSKKADYEQAKQHQSTIIDQCSAMLDAAMRVVAANATQTLSGITNGTNELQAVVDHIAKAQKVADVLADAVTAVSDIVAAVTTLSPGKIASAVSDLKTVVTDLTG